MDPTQGEVEILWEPHSPTQTEQPVPRADQVPDIWGPVVLHTTCVRRFLEELSCRLKKITQPKRWELYFIWRTFWGLQGQEAASQVVLRDCSEEVREKPGYIGVLQQRPGSRNMRRLLLTKENQKSQVNEFSTFLRMGRCKSLGSLKSLLWYAP